MAGPLRRAFKASLDGKLNGVFRQQAHVLAQGVDDPGKLTSHSQRRGDGRARLSGVLAGEAFNQRLGRTARRLNQKQVTNITLFEERVQCRYQRAAQNSSVTRLLTRIR
jgi:hypothetical protein